MHRREITNRQKFLESITGNTRVAIAEEETGGVSDTLTEDELKDYMQQVIRETDSK